MIEREIKEAHLHLTYRQDLDILFLRWFSRPETGQLRKGYLQALAMAQEVGGSYWMFDSRSRGALSDEDEAWVMQEYFPLVETTLGQKMYFANLVTPSHYTFIEENIGLEYLAQYGELCTLGIFTSEQDSVAWLLKSRADR